MVGITPSGKPGQGGQGSGTLGSGYGGDGGSGRFGPLKGMCKGSDHVHTDPVNGAKGQDGYRVHPGAGGNGGSDKAPAECRRAGFGGAGGDGAGEWATGTGHNRPATGGAPGKDGCVTLTYTP
ncbi:hypothetical protein OV450_7775 [Actinobacteria bacterium OV450]|nr:hypothetical protein OV450_7775 [Actinobacteria bacterium OV450]